MLSPRTRATESEPMKSAPMMKACARPSGLGWTAYVRLMSQADPSEEVLELGEVARSGDDQDLADAGKHQRRKRVVDHRLVVNRHELLADSAGDRVKSCPGAPGEDDSLHGSEANVSAGFLLRRRLPIASPHGQHHRGSQPVSRWLVVGANGMLGQDLLAELGRSAPQDSPPEDFDEDFELGESPGAHE